jgi:hypothetical protein
MSLKKLAWMAGVWIMCLTVAAVPGYSDTWDFQDDDVDAILRCTNVSGPGTGCTPLTSGTISVGDIFFAVFEIPTFAINGVASIPAGQELTGVAAVQLTAINGINLTFNSWNGLQTFISRPGLAAGTTIAMWLNGTAGGADRNLNLDAALLNGATNCTSVTDCFQQATLGTLFQADGFTGPANSLGGLTPGPDEFWLSSLAGPATLDIATILGTSRTLNVATFSFATTNSFNSLGPVGFINPFTGLACATDAAPCVRGLVGTGNVQGGQGLTNGFIAHSDFDLQKEVPVIPEPTTVSLLGLGLLALGALRLRKKA